jgi:hypothetical protein
MMSRDFHHPTQRKATLDAPRLSLYRSTVRLPLLVRLVLPFLPYGTGSRFRNWRRAREAARQERRLAKAIADFNALCAELASEDASV